MAITLLGFKNIKSLVLLVTASNMFIRTDLSGFFKFFWKHSIINAFMAKEMAIKTGNKGLSDECFLAGLLHDIGQVALFNADPTKYGEVRRRVATEAVRISIVEQELFGTNHREVGAEVLRNWSFPDVYIDSAKEHGSPNVTSEFKQIILLISISDFLTSNIDTHVEAPLDVKLLDDIMRQSSLTYEDLGYYTGEFLEKMRSSTSAARYFRSTDAIHSERRRGISALIPKVAEANQYSKLEYGAPRVPDANTLA